MHRTNGISGGHQACAACKHQRKKCTDKCILAPFFPADKVREFQAVHKVFGVSNVQKMVKNIVTEDERKRAADSLVWEALCRQKDPILGPYGEYRRVYDELKLYRAQAQTHQTGPLTMQNGSNGLVYKSGHGLIGWSMNGNGSGCNNNNKVSCGGGIHESVGLVDFGPVMDSGLYGSYGAQNNVSKDVNGVGSVLGAQQQLVNGFNQHYYLPGEV